MACLKSGERRHSRRLRPRQGSQSPTALRSVRSLIFLYLFNPVVTSLRGLWQTSELGKVLRNLLRIWLRTYELVCLSICGLASEDELLAHKSELAVTTSRFMNAAPVDVIDRLKPVLLGERCGERDLVAAAATGGAEHVEGVALSGKFHQ
jgi:hypothetical protein